MPGPRCSARQGCASRRETQSATKGPWRLAASSAASALTGAYLAHLNHRPGLDETVLKRGCLLTNQPCESTVTAVGEVQVLVLHGARQCLADYRATGEEAGFGASQTIIRRLNKGLLAVRGSGLLADREVNEPSTGPDAPLDASTGSDALPTPATEKLRQRVGRKRP